MTHAGVHPRLPSSEVDEIVSAHLIQSARRAGGEEALGIFEQDEAWEPTQPNCQEHGQPSSGAEGLVLHEPPPNSAGGRTLIVDAGGSPRL